MSGEGLTNENDGSVGLAEKKLLLTLVIETQNSA